MTLAAAAGRPARGPVSRAAVVLAAVVVLFGCAAPLPAGQSTETSDTSSVASSARASTAPAGVPQARQGRPARSSRVRFVPQFMTLPGGHVAEVRPAATVDGELRVPEQVKHVGWWDGSSYAGDPFGTTVIAGHVDSATEGLGFFVRLLAAKVGDAVLLRGDGHDARYRIVSVQVIAKGALASDSRAFDQTGEHRLVLITCTGDYHRDRGGYDSNLVVTAVPVGPAR